MLTERRATPSLLAVALAAANLVSAGCAREPAPPSNPVATPGQGGKAANEGLAVAATPAVGTGAESTPASPGQCEGLAAVPTRLPAASRLVSFGDVHGDLGATMRVLRLVGVVDDGGTWSGGATVVVQTGDILDRGDDEEAILDVFERLASQASAAGGAFIQLNGNHEYMNADGDFRYVTRGGFADFSDASTVEEQAAERRRRFAPGGDFAVRLAKLQTAVVVGDTLFVHGGVEPRFADAVEDWNCAARRWLAGLGAAPEAIQAPDGPVWSRAFGEDPPDCAGLAKSLTTVGVKRMVIGHTVQPSGVSSACDGAVWRIDVGLAKAYGGPSQAIEIIDGVVNVLRGDNAVKSPR